MCIRDRALGPLVRSWTMRHEAKLHLLKCAGRASNFKNISQTVSHWHQQLMCYDLATGGVLHPALECGPSNSSLTVPLKDESSLIKNKYVMLYLILVMMSWTSWAKINGLTYKSNNSYVLSKTTDTDIAEPTVCFGCIKEILVVSSFIFSLYLQIWVLWWSLPCLCSESLSRTCSCALWQLTRP